VVKEVRKIVIDNSAKNSLKEIYTYIRKDSLQNADIVKEKILSSIKELVTNPERYNLDKYRIDNDGTFRAFEIYKYRISYHLSPTQIRIIRIRHTKRNPVIH
jgi:plasmid stabilization system protein ParE